MIGRVSRGNFVSDALLICGMKLPRLTPKNEKKAVSFRTGVPGKPARTLVDDARLVPWAAHRGSVDCVGFDVPSDSEICVN